MSEEYGNDKLIEIGLVLAEAGMKLEDAFDEDSPKGTKFSFLQEGVPLFVFILPKAIGLAGDAETIKLQFQNATPEDWDVVVQAIADKLDLENDQVEKLIEVGLEWVEATNNLRLAVRDIIKKDEVSE